MNAILFFALTGIGADPTCPLQVDPPVADRGEVKAGAPLVQTFTLKNVGPSTLAIKEVAAGCGCLRPRISKQVLQPGESAELTLEVNTLAQSAGPNSWKATLRFESGPDGRGASGERVAVVKANVVREIEVEPVALFLAIDRTAKHTITVTDRRAKPFTVTSASCDCKHVKVEVVPGEKNTGPRRQQVAVTVLDSCPTGHSREQIVLTTDDPLYRELRVPLIVSRRAANEVSATPEQLDLRLARGQTAASGLVRLRDPDDRPVVVESMEADHPVLRFKWAAGPGSMATLRLGVEFTGAPTSSLGSVTIRLKQPKPQVIVVPVSWQSP